jgi:hypothetical protein
LAFIAQELKLKQGSATMTMQRLEPDLTRGLLLGIGNCLREDLAATVPAPQSLMKLLAQLEARTQTEIDPERCYAAVDRAVAELVSMDRR